MNSRVFFVFLTLFLFAFLAEANDGVDRYHEGKTAQFRHLYAPLSEKEGFTVLAEDMAGGADGAPDFRWARSFPITVIRLTAFETAREMGTCPYPMAIFDMTTEYGDTPVSRLEGKPPRGRHPGGSHDGGVNIDLGYYLTSLKGLYSDPDYSACDEHYSSTQTDEEGLPADVYECMGPANRLDKERQSYFFLQLFKMHVKPFNYMLLESVGVDYHVKKAVMDQLRKWQAEGMYEITDDLLHEMDSIMTCARWEGWAKFHHHHTHVRFHDLSTSGEFRRIFNKLEEDERQMELVIQQELYPEQDAFIKAELLSYNLNRCLELRLLSDNMSDIVKAEYQLEQGDWISSEEPGNNFRCIIDIPRIIPYPEQTLLVRAKYEDTEGKAVEIQREIYVPAQKAQDKIRIEKDKIRAHYETIQENDAVIWECTVEYPEHFNYYITEINYVFYIRETPEKPAKIKPEGNGRKIRFIQPEDRNVEMIEAEITLTARMRFSIPVYIAIN